MLPDGTCPYMIVAGTDGLWDNFHEGTGKLRYQDLKSKMEYANRELKQGLTAEIKTTREQLEDDLDINKKKLVETDDRLQAMIMEETAAREQNCTDVVSSTGATMSQKDKEQSSHRFR